MAIASVEDKMLVLAPHVDDEINCAGAIYEARHQGADVYVVACSGCQESIPDGFEPDAIEREFLSACESLKIRGLIMSWPVRRLSDHRQDILELFVRIRANYDPDVVLCPSSTDIHQDHATVYNEALRAFRGVDMLLGWDSPNNRRLARTDLFVELSREAVEAKVNTWRIYKTQHARTYFDDSFIRALAVVRGKQSRVKSGLAEAYEAISIQVTL